MLKIFWQKIKQNHLLLMVLCCLVPIVLIIGLLSLVKESSNYWIWLIILLCPLSHVFMMKRHGYGDSSIKEADEKDGALYRCSECGLEYRGKEWALKCEDWCKKYKGCNIEITKHATMKGGEKI